MPITKAKKQEVAKELVDKFKKAKIAIFSDFHGVSVSKSQALRRLLKKEESEFKVSKKTLLDRALKESGADVRAKELQGEIGVAFGYGDEVAPARILWKFSRQNETFKILGGILGGKILSGKEILELAKLPSREIILGQLVGVLASPIRGLETVLQGNFRNLVVVLNKIKDNRT